MRTAGVNVEIMVSQHCVQHAVYVAFSTRVRFLCACVCVREREKEYKVQQSEEEDKRRDFLTIAIASSEISILLLYEYRSAVYLVQVQAYDSTSPPRNSSVALRNIEKVCVAHA